jgi:hypothetical protein
MFIWGFEDKYRCLTRIAKTMMLLIAFDMTLFLFNKGRRKNEKNITA